MILNVIVNSTWRFSGKKEPAKQKMEIFGFTILRGNLREPKHSTSNQFQIA
jgi:hypothetical protein